VRARVGYGGGDFALHDGVAYWVEQESARIYRQDLAGGPARPVTPGFGLAASPAVSPDGHWLAYLHSDDDGVDRIAVVDSEGLLWPQVLVEGHDFFSQPRWSPDGKALAWIAWDHPNMPWDGSTLYVAQVVAGDSALPAIGEARAVAGGPDVAVFQPEWSADGSRLLYVSDESGWGQLYAADLATGDVQQLTHGEAEHGTPAWVQDMRTYAVSGDGLRVYITRQEGGFSRVQRLDLTSGRIEDVVALREYTCIERIAASPVGDAIAVIASAPRTPTRVVVFDGESGSARVVARSSSETVPASELAAPESLSWATGDGEMAHGLFYPPQSTRLASVGAPPLVVLVHGGPTSQSRAAWSPAAQFLATRGYGVLMLNYRGSTGYGRDYMLRLRGNWGVTDVEDAVSGVRYLAETGRADGTRAVIMGGSAGGYTVLQAMIEEPDVFCAGIDMYGVSDLFHLASDTHKFEARYLDTLIGPLPEAAPLYRERSPVNHAELIRRPLAVFQGDQDQAVPQAQSDRIVEALRRSGTPCVYHVYEGEGHGFRKQETIEHFWAEVDRFLRDHVVYA